MTRKVDMTEKEYQMTEVGIATFLRCHLDQRERSHAAIIRSKKGILDNTRFFAGASK